MDFNHAISAHSDWKRRLSSYLQKPDGSIKAAEVASNNRCELGKWIASEGAKFSCLQEFSLLKAEHTRFHEAAADIVMRADKGERVSEEVALGAQSEFGHASTAVVQAIMHIKASVSH